MPSTNDINNLIPTSTSTADSDSTTHNYDIVVVGAQEATFAVKEETLPKEPPEQQQPPSSNPNPPAAPAQGRDSVSASKSKPSSRKSSAAMIPLKVMPARALYDRTTARF